MKKTFVLILLTALLLLALTSCELKKPKIEDFEWKMIMIKDENSIVASEIETAYMKPTEMILTAKDGKLILTDNTRGKTYEGSYTKSNNFIEDIYEVLIDTNGITEYEITLNGNVGSANLRVVKYADDSTLPMLSVKIDKYTIDFYYPISNHS